MQAGKLRHRIRIQRPVADDAFDGAGSGGWALVAEVAANVQDMLPSRGERLAEGFSATQRPSRVRIRYRAGVTSSMRILIGRNVRDEDDEIVWQTDRTAQIVSEPAELGFRDGLEFMVEEYRPAGNPA